MTAPPVLSVRDLHVRAETLEAIRGISFDVPAGGRVGVVGESGAGKSLTALAIMGLLGQGWSTEGSIFHDGVNLLTQNDRAMSTRRGRTLSMVFQDPLTALNPTQRVGRQIGAVLRRHTSADKESARRSALELLTTLSLPRPESILRSYPHQLSGGQRQRILIAIAVACYPQLIIADEPTTALDVTVQKEVLRLLDTAVRDRECALLLITHDLPVIAAMCEWVLVMYCGRVVEAGPIEQTFTTPKHPYTASLLRAQPNMDNIALESSSRLVSIPGVVPALDALPSGCAFRDRCDRTSKSCLTDPVPEGEVRRYECWHPLQGADVGEEA